ncbi:UNVERIFIED_CONTAM: hypothetical protein K2H54_004393 [Gekko kuhli]
MRLTALLLFAMLLVAALADETVSGVQDGESERTKQKRVVEKGKEGKEDPYPSGLTKITQAIPETVPEGTPEDTPEE